jgi:hypothetical protein
LAALGAGKENLIMTGTGGGGSSSGGGAAASSGGSGGGGGSFMNREFGLRKRDPDNPDEFEPNLVFVIMSFKGDDTQETYTAIKDECLKLSLKPTRVDENIGSGFIIKEIITLIEKAEFIICDLTYERPNVYYELGYAHGVGNQPLNILLVAKEGAILHFDIAPLRVQYYRSTEHLRSIIASNLQRMIELTRKENSA